MAKRRPDPIKVGIVGAGLLGSAHARVVAASPNAVLQAVAETRPAVGRKVVRGTGAAWYADHGKMLAAEELDAVIVATPDPLHRAPIVAAARAGVPTIITEKPLATVRADALKMRDAVHRAGASLYILFPNRFAPLDRAVRYAFRNRMIGAPVYGDVRLDDNISVPTEMWGSRTKAWASGSSTAHFLFSHVVDLLRWYCQPADVVEVRAVSQQKVLRYTPDLYEANLIFSNGLLVRIKSEWIRRMDALVEFELGFSGKSGSLYYRKLPAFRAQAGLRIDLDHTSAVALVRHQKALARQGVRARVVSDPSARTTAALEVLPEDNPQQGNALEHYLETIRAGRKAPRIEGFGPLPSLDDAIRQVEIVTAIVDSAEKSRTIKVK